MEKIERKINNLKKALKSLEESLDSPITEARDMAGIIKNFEFVYELSWKALKAALEEAGKVTYSPREALEAAYQFQWIEDPELWPKIIADRNLTSHTYDFDLAENLIDKIKLIYFPEFKRLTDYLYSRCQWGH